jgi:PAS domain S-box-containing protein
MTAKKNHRWVRTIGQPNYTNEKITSISGTFQDITEKMIERQKLDKVIQMSSLLIEIESQNVDLKKITRTMIEISGAFAASFNIFEEDGHEFTTVAFDVLNENARKALNLLGYDVVNKKWNRDPHREDMIKDQNITRFESLHELTEGVINNSIIKIIEKTFNLGYTFILKISKEGKLLGDFTLMFTKGETFLSQNIAELFANQVGIYIEKWQAEKALKISESRHKQMIANIWDVISISDEDGTIVYHSDNLIDEFGWKSEDIIGKSFKELIHPDDLSRISDDFLKLKKKPKATNAIEFKHLCKDGSYKLVSLSVINLLSDPIIKGFLTAYHDISKRRQAEEQNIILNRAVENSPASIVITDSNGLIEYINPRFTAITGYTFDEAIGQNPRILKSGNMPISIYHELWDTILKGKEWRGELENKKKNGELYWEMASISGIKNEQGIITHFVAVKEDITSRKEFIEEIESKNEQLQLTNAQKDKFLSIIAHDLRGPFSGFLGLTEILAKNINSLPLDDIKDLAQEMKHSAGNLYDLLSNLLEWSRTQRGLIDFKPEEIDMTEIVSHSFETFYETGRQKQVVFVSDVPKSSTAKADRYMLQTVLRNLISNALKFTAKGGKISLTIQPTSSGEIICAIKDTGVGMPKKILENLFRIDVNVSRAGTNNEPSTGLGLILCKEFVEKHGGRIWAESEEGHGSTFYFTLPGTSK